MGKSKPPLATDNLLENTDGVPRPDVPPQLCRGTPSVFSRGGTLLPSIYGDARYIDAVLVSLGRFPAGSLTACSTTLGQEPRLTCLS